MLKALLKKQFRELSNSLFQNKKSGKRRSTLGVIGYAVFFAAVFAMLGWVFYKLGELLAPSMIRSGLDWLYFAIMGLIAIALGVFGSVFNTYSGLYLARDNELLLSMPIPVRWIIAVRLTGVYAMGMLYEGIVLVPALIAYWVAAELTPLLLLCGVVMVFAVGVLVLAMTCALGYVVARLSTRLKNKSFVTVLVSLLFIAGYYYVYFRFNEMLQDILANSAGVSEIIHSWAYPVYLMGVACAGDVLSLLLYVAGAVALFALCYLIMQHTFLKVATSNRGQRKAVYREKTAKAASAKGALLRREWKRFTSSSSYMLNCGLGTVLMPAAAVLVVLKRESIRNLLDMLSMAAPHALDCVPLAIVIVVCMFIPMNDMTAPSISLEGKNIWIAQSLPVDPWTVLSAKLRLQYLLNTAPVILVSVALCWVTRLGYRDIILVTLLNVIYMVFLAQAGLMLNLLKPNLHWTNETYVIKQSGAALIVIFGGWAMAVAIGAGYYFLRERISALAYLIGLLVLFALATRLLDRWLRKKGTTIFARL